MFAKIEKSTPCKATTQVPALTRKGSKPIIGIQPSQTKPSPRSGQPHSGELLARQPLFIGSHWLHPPRVQSRERNRKSNNLLSGSSAVSTSLTMSR